MMIALYAVVQAVDKAGYSATFTLTVNILDVDEPPVFTPASCSASVPENMVGGWVHAIRGQINLDILSSKKQCLVLAA